MSKDLGLQAPDLERRFGGLRRLYGNEAYEKLRKARVAVVGLGGVGSWAAEALARSGVAELVLIDMDHVSESNINRQVQALGATLGQAKVIALRERMADIHPGCVVHVIDDFVTSINWPALLSQEVDVVIDACDQVKAKVVMAQWALQTALPLVSVGAAGGKKLAQAVEVDDLAGVTHDPLLASMRQRLRKQLGSGGKSCIGIRCVFSREPVISPVAACESEDAALNDGGLNCHGYGSSVMVTATFGMVAAGVALQSALECVGETASKSRI